ncbi:unnamed protein product [Gongylonema pulchrum]|uniref:C2 domain-containing protein n=1 Tax=Gongylonema pulchrum TaxID=637853 RepID=A0A183D558_9BILA|nr:unnamed protein product [Gongylonema pulchrum]
MFSDLLQGKDDFGDLLLYLAYSVIDRKLFVTVSKAYNLRPMDITGASDPYVKVEQIYQRRRVKARKTSIKRANLNPVYHECLEFDLPLNEIEQTNLLVQVMDWDRPKHHSVGTWHSILDEVPEEFRNIPKAKK